MKRLIEQGERIARARQRAVLARVAAAFAGARVDEAGDAVVIRGRGLLRRWLSDASLRFAGGWR